jgi:hypothetical protein
MKTILASLVLWAALCASALGASLAWDPNSEAHLAGYKIYYGLSPRQYTQSVDVGNVTTWQIPNSWPGGQTYFFAATAYGNCTKCPDTKPNCLPSERIAFVCESGYSNEVFWAKPAELLPEPAKDLIVTWAVKPVKKVYFIESVTMDLKGP